MKGGKCQVAGRQLSTGKALNVETLANEPLQTEGEQEEEAFEIAPLHFTSDGRFVRAAVTRWCKTDGHDGGNEMKHISTSWLIVY